MQCTFEWLIRREQPIAVIASEKSGGITGRLAVYGKLMIVDAPLPTLAVCGCLLCVLLPANGGWAAARKTASSNCQLVKLPCVLTVPEWPDPSFCVLVMQFIQCCRREWSHSREYVGSCLE